MRGCHKLPWKILTSSTTTLCPTNSPPEQLFQPRCLSKMKLEHQTVKKISCKCESGQHFCNCFSWLFLLLLFQEGKKGQFGWTYPLIYLLKSFRAYCLHLQRTVLAYPLGICQLSSAHQSKYWGGVGGGGGAVVLEPDTEWELLLKHFSIRREKN